MKLNSVIFIHSIVGFISFINSPFSALHGMEGAPKVKVMFTKELDTNNPGCYIPNRGNILKRLIDRKKNATEDSVEILLTLAHNYFLHDNGNGEKKRKSNILEKARQLIIRSTSLKAIDSSKITNEKLEDIFKKVKKQMDLSANEPYSLCKITNNWEVPRGKTKSFISLDEIVGNEFREPLNQLRLNKNTMGLILQRLDIRTAQNFASMCKESYSLYKRYIEDLYKSFQDSIVSGDVVEALKIYNELYKYVDHNMLTTIFHLCCQYKQYIILNHIVKKSAKIEKYKNMGELSMFNLHLYKMELTNHLTSLIDLAIYNKSFEAFDIVASYAKAKKELPTVFDHLQSRFTSNLHNKVYYTTIAYREVNNFEKYIQTIQNNKMFLQDTESLDSDYSALLRLLSKKYFGKKQNLEVAIHISFLTNAIRNGNANIVKWILSKQDVILEYKDFLGKIIIYKIVRDRALINKIMLDAIPLPRVADDSERMKALDELLK